MIVFGLESESLEFKKLIEQLGSFLTLELFEDMDFLIETLGDEKCHGVILNLDDQQRKREKNIKQLKKAYVDMPIFLFSNELAAKKIIKHQNSKVGGSAYFNTPVDQEMLKILIQPFWQGEEEGVDINQVKVAEEDLPVLGGEAELSFDSLDDMEDEVNFPDEDDLTFPEMKISDIESKNDEGLPHESTAGVSSEIDLSSFELEEDESLDLGNDTAKLGIIMEDDSSDDFVSEVEMNVETEELFEKSEAIEDELTRPALSFELPDEEVEQENQGFEIDSDDFVLANDDIDEFQDDEEFSIDLGESVSLSDEEEREINSSQTETSTSMDSDFDTELEESLSLSDEEELEIDSSQTKTSIAMDSDIGDIEVPEFDEEEAEAEKTVLGLGLDLSLDEVDELKLGSNIEEDIDEPQLPDLVENIEDFDFAASATDDSAEPVEEELLTVESGVEEKEDSIAMLNEELDVSENIIQEDQTDQFDTIEQLKVEESESALDEDATVVFQVPSSENNKDKTATRVNHIGAEARTSITTEHKNYVQTHDDELVRLGETIHHLREDRRLLQDKILEMEAKKDDSKYDFLNLQALLDESKIELVVVRKRLEGQNEELKTKLDISLDRRSFLEKQNKKFSLEIEKLSKQKRVDTSRIHQRERELEEKLEMLRKDAEIQLRNRDQKILELKRRIDSLEFDVETSRAKEVSSVSEQLGLEEKMDSVIKTLRSAIGQLEDDHSELEKRQMIKKNLKL